MKLKKDDFNSSLIKGLIATFIFSIAYTFVYSLVLKSHDPLRFLAEKGYVNTYLFLSVVIASIPYTLCGYFIMLGRNRIKDLKRKQAVLALAVATISLAFYLIIAGVQFIFAYRDINIFYIMMNYPLLRSLLTIDLTGFQINITMLLSTFVPSIFIYLGGLLRLKAFRKEI